MTEIVVATKNSGKVKELRKLLADLPFQIKSLDEFSNIIEADETGVSFVENAVIKAQSYPAQTGLWSLADDSGLEIAALNGAPGIFSARYAGENADDREKISKILVELDKTNDQQRLARFVCAMAISDEKGEIKFLTEGICAGKIALTPSGDNGFGYDPIFVPDGFTRTFGELPGEIKQKISHRAWATEKIIAFLNQFNSTQLDL